MPHPLAMSDTIDPHLSSLIIYHDPNPPPLPSLPPFATHIEPSGYYYTAGQDSESGLTVLYDVHAMVIRTSEEVEKWRRGDTKTEQPKRIVPRPKRGSRRQALFQNYHVSPLTAILTSSTSPTPPSVSVTAVTVPHLGRPLHHQEQQDLPSPRDLQGHSPPLRPYSPTQAGSEPSPLISPFFFDPSRPIPIPIPAPRPPPQPDPFTLPYPLNLLSNPPSIPPPPAPSSSVPQLVALLRNQCDHVEDEIGRIRLQINAHDEKRRRVGVAAWVASQANQMDQAGGVEKQEGEGYPKVKVQDKVEVRENREVALKRKLDALLDRRVGYETMISSIQVG